MSGNSFGKLFKITTCGESHGGAVGVIIDGCPPGIEISLEEIQADLDRRKPGQSAITTPRSEADLIHALFKECISPIACRFYLFNEIWYARLSWFRTRQCS